jgi:diacylglycerol kinase
MDAIFINKKYEFFNYALNGIKFMLRFIQKFRVIFESEAILMVFYLWPKVEIVDIKKIKKK